MAFSLRSSATRCASLRKGAFKPTPVSRRLVAPVRASAVSEIVDKLKTLTLLEASELVSEIEKTFGVDASAAAAAPVAMAAGPAAAAAPVVEEKTTFDVVLEEIPADKKVAIYKVVRSIANIAVNQVKDFTATLPKVLKEGASKEDAEEARRLVADAGGKVKVV
ncbi:plastid/chloroplast ribosomal protein L7/L12 [Haematococcus lacustris]